MFTVKQSRQLADLTQVKVAELLSMNVDTYRKLERHPEKFTIENAKTFCQIVGRTMEEIFFDENSTLSRDNKSA